MNWREKNLQQIQLGFPELYERIIELKEDAKTSLFQMVDFLETDTTPCLVTVQREGETIRWNSLYDPEHEAEVWVEAQEDTAAANLFILGLGNGSFPRSVIKKRGEESRILIYEPSLQIFLKTLECVDIREFFGTPGVRVIVEGLNEDMYTNVMEEMLTMENFEDKSFLVAPRVGAMFPESRKRFVQGYLDGVGWLMGNRNSIRRFICRLPYNLLHNLQYVKEATLVTKLKEKWETDVPVVVIGAGLSLKENLKDLKELGDKAFLFAVDSAMPYLLEHDIIPDAFVCIEADKPMHFLTDERVNDIPLFCRIATTHQLLDKHRASKVFGYDEEFILNLYEEAGVCAPTYRYGGNGATSFFAICKELGVRNVIFLGQDMAYKENESSHVGGRDEGYEDEERFRYIDNSGEMVQSRQDWHRFIKWYENAIPVMKFEHVINTAPHGVYVKGTEYMPFREAIELYGKSHSTVEEIIGSLDETGYEMFEDGFQEKYKLWNQEIQEIRHIIEKDCKNEKRKSYEVYELLKMYETADLKEDFAKSQKEGIELIANWLEECLGEK